MQNFISSAVLRTQPQSCPIDTGAVMLRTALRPPLAGKQLLAPRRSSQIYPSPAGSLLGRMHRAISDSAYIDPDFKLEGSSTGPLQGLTFAVKDLFDVRPSPMCTS